MIHWEPDHDDPYLGWIRQLDNTVTDQNKEISRLRSALLGMAIAIGRLDLLEDAGFEIKVQEENVD